MTERGTATVHEVGPGSSVQDLGRGHHAALGVGRSGAADRGAHRLANRLVGNAEHCASIEILLGRLSLSVTRATTFAVTGAVGGGAPCNTAFTVAAGAVVRLGPVTSGLRSYLAVRGGWDVAPVLGSRSCDVLGGLGPTPLHAGQSLPIGLDVLGPPSDDAVPARAIASEITVRVVPGPRRHWFTAGAWDRFVSTAWTVRADSNRVGVRLAGPALDRAITTELASEATLPGAVQVPGDGRPIVLGPDAPVTGGYPVIAVVLDADLDLLAQSTPSSRVRFLPVGNIGL